MNPHRAIRGLLAQAVFSCLLVASHPGELSAQWTQTNGPRGGFIRSFVTVPDGAGGASLYSGQSGVWRTDDHGASWAHLDDGLTDPNAFALVAVSNASGGHDLLVGTANGIFRSGDGGATWNPGSSGVPANLSIYSLASGPNGSGGDEPVRRDVSGQPVPLDRPRRQLDRGELRHARRPGPRARADHHDIGDGAGRDRERHLSLRGPGRELDTGLHALRALLRQERRSTPEPATASISPPTTASAGRRSTAA